VDRLFSSWRWTRTHRSSGAVGDWGCADCPHTRVFGLSGLSASLTIAARQPYGDPIVLGGGPRPPGLPGVVQGGSCPVGCRVHPSGWPPVLPTRLVRVRMV